MNAKDLGRLQIALDHLMEIQAQLQRVCKAVHEAHHSGESYLTCEKSVCKGSTEIMLRQSKEIAE